MPFIFLVLLTATSCSNVPSKTMLRYDTSFTGGNYGNMFCDESGSPEGFINYGSFFTGAFLQFRLDGSCQYVLKEKNKEGIITETIENGTYTAGSPYRGSVFNVTFDNGRSTTFTWQPNWHDPGSTPYWVSEAPRKYTLLATGETINLIISLYSNYTSEM